MVRGQRSTMSDTVQRCEGGVDSTSTGSPSSVSDETDPAGIVLIARVVQACVSQRFSTLRYRLPPRQTTDDDTKRMAPRGSNHTRSDGLNPGYL